MIYLIAYAKGKYLNREEAPTPMVYWGYYTSEAEANRRVEELTREAYTIWRVNAAQAHARAREDYLYPELIGNSEENDLIRELFGNPIQTELDLSESAYRESGQASIYTVLPVASATDRPFTIPSLEI